MGNQKSQFNVIVYKHILKRIKQTKTDVFTFHSVFRHFDLILDIDLYWLKYLKLKRT